MLRLALAGGPSSEWAWAGGARIGSWATFDPKHLQAPSPRRAARAKLQPGDPEIKPRLCWEAVDMTWEGSFMGVLGKNGVVKAGVLRVHIISGCRSWVS